ncbi:cytidine deaminase [Saccharospirillum impatiens]|uniref:cytidine deaminase n=1 Tax=Saccharospirillum impatiens TaxID=169438 RepID=UPI00040891B9|nr:cytidine deaminase [Saccharospirillum impatiens]
MTAPSVELKAAAKAVAANAYVPYSQFPVGAALRTLSGDVFSGCNIENRSYPLGMCGERNAINTAAATGVRPGDIAELVVFMPGEHLFSPCGGCRQVIAEFMPADGVVWATNDGEAFKRWTVAELLPDGFSFEGL